MGQEALHCGCRRLPQRRHEAKRERRCPPVRWLTMTASSEHALPVIDIAPLLQPGAIPSAVDAVDQCIGRACTHAGFFYIIGHGIPDDLQRALHSASKKFFSLDSTIKEKVAMSLGGKAWRGRSIRRVSVRMGSV